MKFQMKGCNVIRVGRRHAKHEHAQCVVDESNLFSDRISAAVIFMH